jgi:hypothetical protein
MLSLQTSSNDALETWAVDIVVPEWSDVRRILRHSEDNVVIE